MKLFVKIYVMIVEAASVAIVWIVAVWYLSLCRLIGVTKMSGVPPTECVVCIRSFHSLCLKKFRLKGKTISYYMCDECIEKNINNDRVSTDLGKGGNVDLHCHTASRRTQNTRAYESQRRDE